MLAATDAFAAPGTLGGPSEPVTTVRRGRTFIGLLRSLEPRLAVLSSPPAGPRELRAAAAERRRRSSLRLIYVNDADDIAGRLDALARGFDDAVPATIDPAELAGRARLLVAGAEPLVDPARRIPIATDVVLDLVGRRVRRSGTDVHLRPKEFGLLATLASDPGRVFSRSELIDRVWGPSYHGGERTVDVHVRWLRAKVEPDPATPTFVVTVRGAGYRLDQPPR